MKKRTLWIVVIVIVIAALIWWFTRDRGPAQDEAMAAGVPVEFYAQPDDEPDYFADADGGIQLTPAEVRGRNTWWVWTAGNQAFWDYLTTNSFGTFDLLKTLSSYPCSPEGEEAAKGYEATLPAPSPEGTEYGAGGYGYTAPAGGYEYEIYPGVCADTMYPEEGQAPYRYYSRDTRFCYTGLINEPGFEKPSKPDKWGLCLDQRTTSRDPYDEEVYGRPSGVMGLRIFDNPNFDEAAQKRWDPVRFYTDPGYYSDRELVRPYRIGMSCGFCHISHHPLHPPADPESPAFANMSGTIGAQYFWFGRVLGANVTADNFAFHLLEAQRPGAVDTSFVPADNINNPRAMNSVFDLPARLAAAGRFHTEKIDGGALDLPEVQQKGETFGVPQILWDGADSVGVDAALTRVYINIGEYHQEWLRHIRPIIGGKVQTPITVKAAQENSVFWNATQARAGDMAAYLIRAGYPYRLADVGKGPGTAAEEAEAAAAGDEGAAAAAAAATRATGGRAAPEGGSQPAATGRTAPAAGPDRGKVAFAENCARCHSSKLPPDLPGLDGGPECQGEGYLECWWQYWQHTETPEFKAAMTEMVLADDFLTDNYLSTDARIPVHQPLADWQPPAISEETRARYRQAAAERGDEVSDTLIDWLERLRLRGLATGALESELCSAMATNALEGHVWDNFASRSYKSLPAVGTVEIYDPIRDLVFDWRTPGDGKGELRGRGYQRVPTLIGIWSTAPYLHNNEVGIFTNDPSVAGRLAAFDDAISKLLWPERRPNVVSVTRRKTALRVQTSALPAALQPLVSEGRFINFLRSKLGLGNLVGEGQVRIGPIPDRTPVNLLANLNLDRSDPRFEVKRLLHTLEGMGKDLYRIDNEKLSDEQATELLKRHVPELLALSNCPDFVADRGHYFGSQLSDEDKEALIAYVKTF